MALSNHCKPTFITETQFPCFSICSGAPAPVPRAPKYGWGKKKGKQQSANGASVSADTGQPRPHSAPNISSKQGGPKSFSGMKKGNMTTKAGLKYKQSGHGRAASPVVPGDGRVSEERERERERVMGSGCFVCVCAECFLLTEDTHVRNTTD